MFKNTSGRLVLVSAGVLFATVLSVGCSSDSSSGGTGGKGTGGKGTGGGATGGSGTGGAATGGSGTGGSATGGAATGGSAAGGSATGGAGGSVGGAGGTAGSAGGTAGASGGAAGSAGGTAGSAGGTAGSAGGHAGAAGGSAGSAGGAAGAGGAPTSALATIAALTPGTITGTAEFVNVTGGVQVTINLQNCPMGTHGIHIHAGTACTDATAQGMHWGGSGTATMPSQGEGIGSGTGQIDCNAQMVGGPLVYTRMNTDPALAWTIGGSASTNVIGHPIIVHGLVATNREGCGVIQAH